VARYPVELEEMREAQGNIARHQMAFGLSPFHTSLSPPALFAFLTGDTSIVEADDSKRILHSSKAKGATLYPLAGQFWPAKFVHYLIKAAQSNGVQLSTHTVVTSIDRSDPSSIVVHTNKGQVRASKVVYATNGYTAGLLPELSGTILPICISLFISD